MIVFSNIYCYRLQKNVILRSKTIFFTVGNAVLRFFKNLESGSPGYVRAYSVSSLTLTPISFFLFVQFIFVLCCIRFFFLFLETFYAFLETRRFPMSPLTNYSKLMRLYSCTEGSDELAHMQYRKGLHKQYRHKVETHPVSKIGPLSA